MLDQTTTQVRYFEDRVTGLRAMIALDDLTLGPAIGGCRIRHDPCPTRALNDVKQLARAMTYKAALAGLPHGGGKSVILPPQQGFNRQTCFERFGVWLNELQGDYLASVDSGTSVQDMAIVAQRSNFVVAAHPSLHPAFDPSYYTALGIVQALKAAVAVRYGSTDLSKKSILIKGCGSVGTYLAHMLHQQQAQLLFADIQQYRSQRLAKKFKGRHLEASKAHVHPVDVLAPCDAGSTVTQDNLASLQANIIVGGANNQLEADDLADDLCAKGVLYCPDYVVNAGGLIYASTCYDGSGSQRAMERIHQIHATTLSIVLTAQSEGCSTVQVANRLVQQCLEAARSRQPSQHVKSTEQRGGSQRLLDSVNTTPTKSHSMPKTSEDPASQQ